MLRNFKTLKGCTLSAKDGEIGKVQEMYFDDAQWVIRYFVVTAGSWLTGRDVLITPAALGELDPQSDTIAVSLTQDQVRNAPPIDSEKPISRQYEQQYYQHYGWNPYWMPGTGVAMIGLAMPGIVAPRLTPNPVPSEPQGDPHLRSSQKVQGYSIRAQDGELGHVSDFILDDQGWRIRYLVIDTRNWLPGKYVLLAPEWIERISFDGAEVFVNQPCSKIKEAPDYDPASTLSRAYEKQLHDHYGQKAYWDRVQGGTR